MELILGKKLGKVGKMWDNGICLFGFKADPPKKLHCDGFVVALNLGKSYKSHRFRGENGGFYGFGGGA